MRERKLMLSDRAKLQIEELRESFSRFDQCFNGLSYILLRRPEWGRRVTDVNPFTSEPWYQYRNPRVNVDGAVTLNAVYKFDEEKVYLLAIAEVSDKSHPKS